MLVHSEKVSGKDSRLVTSGAATYLDDGIFGVIRICRYEKKTDFLLHFGNARFYVGDFLPCHLAQFLVLFVYEYILCRGKILNHLFIFLSCCDDRLKFLIVLVELDILLHIGHHVRAGELFLEGLELVLERKHLFQ